MQPTPPCVSLVLSLVLVSLSSSAPLEGEGQDLDFLKWPGEAASLLDLQTPSLTEPADLSTDRPDWEERLLDTMREELHNQLSERLAGVLVAPGARGKRYNYRPTGYVASRGKRFIPGLESLLLAKYYKDIKPKRQPHYGFHGSRG